MWRETTRHERNLTIFREELDAFLPQRILDFHVHVFPDGITHDGSPVDIAGHPVSHYDLDDLARDLGELYPGRDVSAVCFGMPAADHDRALNNAYLADGCDADRFCALRLFDPNEPDPGTIRQDLIDGGFFGIKPYLNYVRKPDPSNSHYADLGQLQHE